MSLKDADMLVKKGDYAGALRAIQAEKQRHPGNKYADAYKERILALLREGSAWPLDEIPRRPGIAPFAPTGTDGLLSAESRLQKIATPLALPNPEEEKAAAIRGKVTALLCSARTSLAEQRHDVALDAVRRAALLDPENREVRLIEDRVRAAQEELRQRVTREQQEREWDERLRREQRLREELDRIKVEREEKRQHEELKRRLAHEQKVGQSLSRIREFLAAGQLDEAQCELAFVSVLAPGTEAVLAIEAELSRKQQEAEHARLEAQRREIEAARERAALLRAEIERCVAEAEELASREEFDEALRALTDAYLLDPNSEVVESCETRILSARQAWEARAEAERQAAEEAIRQAEAETRARREEEERMRVLAEEERKEKEESERTNREIELHLAAARSSLADGNFREALAEVALAYTIDPLSEAVKEAEDLILREKETPQSASEPQPTPVVELSPEVEAGLATSARLLAEAKRLASDHRYVAALFEAQKALAIDPDNLTTRRLVASITAEYERYQEEQKQGESPRTERGRTSARHRRATPAEKPVTAEAAGPVRPDPEPEPSPSPENADTVKGSGRSWWGRVREAWREAALEEGIDRQGPAEEEVRPPSPPDRPPSSEMPSTLLRLP